MPRLGFPISRDPPEGGTHLPKSQAFLIYLKFPISRDPPEGGTAGSPRQVGARPGPAGFPISRDPPEGGTW